MVSSWFDENYEYRIEEGDLRYSPSKIEAVRRDGEDFDDLHLENLRRRLQATAFPASVYSLTFETDEFRRFIRIYIDFAKHTQGEKKADKIQSWSIVAAAEIRSRLAKIG